MTKAAVLKAEKVPSPFHKERRSQTSGGKKQTKMNVERPSGVVMALVC